MDFQDWADRVLNGGRLQREQALALLQVGDDRLPDLVQGAFRIREHYFGRRVRLHLLMNAKSGVCPEDCAYCSQSAISQAEIDRYSLLSKEQLVQGALKAEESRALRYCIVISARGPTDEEIEAVCEAVREIKACTGLEICCSLGLLVPEQAQRLKAAGVERINHNLNTSRQYYPEICSTHTYDDRVETVKTVQRAGLSTCSGVLAGMGERDEDLVELGFALHGLDVDSIPINFLIPVSGTPLEETHLLTPEKCLKILCLFRFLNPTKEIKVGGGRERHLGKLQHLMFYPANSVFIEGYLTTPGQGAQDTIQMIEVEGFEVEEGSGRLRSQSSTISRL